MARARNIKPGFFTNEDLPEIEPMGRLLFIGLWMLADREGRLHDRPKRIKGELFAYDNVDVDSLLNELQRWNFIKRYSVDGEKYIQVLNFKRHQRPHPTERKSEIPPMPDESGESALDTTPKCVKDTLDTTPRCVTSRTKVLSNPSESLNPESLNPESPNEESLNPESPNQDIPPISPPRGEVVALKARKGRAREPSPFEEVTDSALREALLDYRKMRKAMKAPLTPRSEQIHLRRLRELAGTAEASIAVVNQTIAHGWKSFYPLRDGGGGQTTGNRHLDAAARAIAMLGGEDVCEEVVVSDE